MDQLKRETDNKEVVTDSKKVEKTDNLERKKKHHSTLTIALLIFIAALLLSFFIAFLLSTFTRPKEKPVVASTTSYTYDDESNVCSSCGQVHSCGTDCTEGNGCTSCGTSDKAETESAK